MSMQHKSTCFVMMPFAEVFNPVLEEAIRPAIEACHLRAVRADELVEPGGIPDQIRKGITESLTCIADLTGLNRNVVYEVALAHAQGKSVILVTQDSPQSLPFDLRHFRVLKYAPTREGRQKLRETLALSLSAVIGAPESPTRYLEEMLVPRSLGSREGPFVVAASPLSWREDAKLGGGFTKLRRTCSDYVGIRGMIQAFGLIFGLDRLPDLLNPGDYVDQLVRENAVNLYCIGSPKANRWSGLLLEDFFKRWHPRLEFKPDPASIDLRNIRVMIEINGNPYKPNSFGPKDTDPFIRDFGVLVRGPHPADPNYVLMVMAGRSSLGTEAVCRAATDPRHIAEIKRRLQHERVDLSDHKQGFYVVVTMDLDMTEGGTYEAILSSFEIAEVHAFRHA
jgi:hypothetical protein